MDVVWVLPYSASRLKLLTFLISSEYLPFISASSNYDGIFHYNFVFFSILLICKQIFKKMVPLLAKIDVTLFNDLRFHS